MAFEVHQSDARMVMQSIPAATNRPASLDEVTRTHVLSVLESCGWSQTRAAQVLAIDRKTIYRMLRRWGVDVQTMRAK